MRFTRRLAAGLIMTAVLAIQPVRDTQAAPVLNEQNFDYDWYLEQHPDLAAAVPTGDHDAIWQFYQTVGEPAGWHGRPSKNSILTKTEFDFDTFLGQNPDVYAAFGTDYDQVYDWYQTTGIYEGRSAQAKSEGTNARMKIYDIADSITNSGMSDREKIKAVHDWLCIHVAYDYDNYKGGTIPRSSYEIEGAILYGKSVCSGYARTFQAFMDTLGIESEYIRGEATNSSGHTGGHAWNKVKIDGQWYWIDVTWDDPVPDRPGIVYRYTYFLISEEQMNRNHTPE